MKLHLFQKFTKKILLCSLIAAGIYSISCAGIVAAEDMPILRKGMWEFTRTVENTGNPGKPQTMVTKKCTNPTEDMKKQNEMLSKVGCKLSQVSKSGKTYSFTVDCKIQSTTIQSRSVMTVENDSTYSVKVESSSDAQGTKESLAARRTGDCSN